MTGGHGPVLTEVRAAYARATGQDATYRFRHFVLLAIGSGVRGREALVAHAQRQCRAGRAPGAVELFAGTDRDGAAEADLYARSTPGRWA